MLSKIYDISAGVFKTNLLVLMYSLSRFNYFGNAMKARDMIITENKTNLIKDRYSTA
ncbi:MAG: hypothetical protein PHC75_10605 [Burkholderiales bacterium]|nr:hypothetical protein [Burkholderiales bacterium]